MRARFCSRTERGSQSTRFEGSTIPDPPRQREPWRPPATTLPKLLISASATLFDQGLADPRGYDYRAIEIAIGGVRSNGGWVMKTHGWVLPAPDGEKTRFAVAWSGLVYPTVSIGEPSDPAADVKVIAQEARLTREERTKTRAQGTSGSTASEPTTKIPRFHRRVCTRSKFVYYFGWAGPTLPRWSGLLGRTKRETLAIAKRRRNWIRPATAFRTCRWQTTWPGTCSTARSTPRCRSDDALALVDARKLTAFQKAV